MIHKTGAIFLPWVVMKEIRVECYLLSVQNVRVMKSDCNWTKESPCWSRFSSRVLTIVLFIGCFYVNMPARGEDFPVTVLATLVPRPALSRPADGVSPEPCLSPYHARQSQRCKVKNSNTRKFCVLVFRIAPRTYGLRFLENKTPAKCGIPWCLPGKTAEGSLIKSLSLPGTENGGQTFAYSKGNIWKGIKPVLYKELVKV